MSDIAQTMRIAVVHDYFTQMGGAEKVAEELYRLLPNADLFSTVALRDQLPDGIRDVPVNTSWMQHLPMIRRFYRLYFPLYPFAVNSLDLSGYDLIVSSSSGYVKGIQVNPHAVHVCYCHTPMRWAWSFDSYSARESFGSGVRMILSTLVRALRTWDEGAARQPDHFIANSRVVASRIQRAYGRYAEVIQPPIDVERFELADETGDYYLILSRLVHYKRIDIAVSAFKQMGKKLIVIGTGPALHSLKAAAGPTITFAGRAPDAEVGVLLSRCRALIFPGEEDFGMAPLEAAAAGRPTIAFKAGGALETIIENETGIFFEAQTPQSVVDAVHAFEQMQWSPLRIRAHAECFSREVFQGRIIEFLRRIGSPIQPVQNV